MPGDDTDRSPNFTQRENPSAVRNVPLASVGPSADETRFLSRIGHPQLRTRRLERGSKMRERALCKAERAAETAFGVFQHAAPRSWRGQSSLENKKAHRHRWAFLFSKALVHRDAFKALILRLGAGKGIRTLDFNLGKVALYH
jgi:hypothetical protein